ncbi:MAG: energy-coupling factor ABC transporter permease [Chloroflexales bacterium]|nr:energy-coupling factor ABC transporter permease [Chloroflexales bacterium]
MRRRRVTVNLVVALHIPDGFLTTAVSAVGWLLAIAAVGNALLQTRGQLGERQIPLMGVLAAFIFAAQSINIAVGGGTSGHLLGGTLAAILLGPWAAVLVMACVVAIQALIFQDGGVIALGFNIVNMGVLTAFTGYATYQLTRRLLGPGRRSMLIAGGVGGWLSMMVGAIAVGIELGISGTSPLWVAVPAMAVVHAVLGLIEAGITVGALAFITAARPDLLATGQAAPAQRSARWVVVGLVVTLLIAAFSPLASADPDGLERVAEDQGFLTRALDPFYNILPDYTIPFIDNETVSGIVAVILGTLLVFGVAYGVARSRRTAASSNL